MPRLTIPVLVMLAAPAVVAMTLAGAPRVAAQAPDAAAHTQWMNDASDAQDCGRERGRADRARSRSEIRCTRAVCAWYKKEFSLVESDRELRELPLDTSLLMEYRRSLVGVMSGVGRPVFGKDDWSFEDTYGMLFRLDGTPPLIDARRLNDHEDVVSDVLPVSLGDAEPTERVPDVPQLRFEHRSEGG